MSESSRSPSSPQVPAAADRTDEAGASRTEKRGRERRATDKDRRAMAQTIQQYEQKMSRLQDCLGLVEGFGGDLLFRLTPDGRILTLSAACKRILGQEPASLVKRSLFDLVHGEDREAARRFVREAVAGKTFQVQLRVRDAQGRWIPLGMHARAIPHVTSGEIEIVGLARQGATSSGGALTLENLTSGLAHELNQPLSAITMSARACERLVMRDDADKKLLLEAIRQVTSQAERAVEMVRRMRQLAQGDPPAQSPADLHELIHESLRILDGNIREGNVVTQLHFAKDLPNLLMDRIQISQVLVNLVRNAIEAMGQMTGPRVLSIHTAREGQEVWVSVSDTGPGLAPEVAERLFQPYRSTKPQGMGLGLVLCRSILESHSGRLWAQGRPPPGTTFCFALPLPSENHGTQTQAHRLPRG